MSGTKEYLHLQAIMDFAESEFQKEKTELLESDASKNFIPGDATTFNIAGLIGGEIRRRKEDDKKSLPCDIDRETMAKALDPFYALTAILSKSNAEDIDADDMAKVLGALVHSAWVRTGYPRLGDAL